MSMKLWLEVEVGDKFLSPCDGDTYVVQEALCDIKCRRCETWIDMYEPYARGTWHYSKYHIHCAKYGL